MENRNARRKATAKYNLLELADELGYTVKKIGRLHFTLVEHDSVRININQNTFFQYSIGRGGDAVAFLMQFGVDIDPRFKSLDYAIRYLERKLRITPEKAKVLPVEKKTREYIPLELPKRDAKNDRVITYLTDTRKINRHIVDYFIENNMLYQENDRFKNCVFVSYHNDKPIFASKRSSHPSLRFVMEFEGNNYDRCFFIGNRKSDTLVVTESIIDMMSIMSLGDHVLEKNNFLSLNSVTKTEAVFTHLKENTSIRNVSLFLDADKAGRLAAKKITSRLDNEFMEVNVKVFYPYYGIKDWNDYLVAKSNGVLKDIASVHAKNEVTFENDDISLE